MIRCCPLGHRPLGAWLPHRYPPGLATSVCCRKPLFGRALTSRVISVWLALGNPHPVSATDPGGLRGEASVRHLGKQVAGRGAGQGRGSGDHSRSGNLLHGFLIIPAPLPHTPSSRLKRQGFECQLFSWGSEGNTHRTLGREIGKQSLLIRNVAEAAVTVDH